MRNTILVIIFMILNSITVIGQVNQTDNEKYDSTKSIEEHWIGIGNPFPDNVKFEGSFLKYLVTLDESGKVIDILLIQSAMSEKTEKKYRKHLQGMTFEWKNTNTKPPKIYKGIIEYKMHN